MVANRGDVRPVLFGRRGLSARTSDDFRIVSDVDVAVEIRAGSLEEVAPLFAGLQEHGRLIVLIDDGVDGGPVDVGQAGVERV